MRHRIASLLLAGTAWSGTVAAQEFELGAVPLPPAPPPLFTSAVEVGVGYQSTDSFFFARYGGRAEEGAFVLVNGVLIHRPSWDAGDGTFIDAQFHFNGQDTPSAWTRFGKQGRWRMAAAFESFSLYKSESARTPFDGIGSDQLSLPTNWFSSSSALLFRTLPTSLKSLELKTKWETAGGDLVLTLREGFEARIRFDHRDRDGLKASFLTFGHESLFPVGVFFPQPVNYETDQVQASLAYADRTWQWNATYSLATFRNDLAGVIVPNPFLRSLGTIWPAGSQAGYPFAIGQYSLPPSNTSHQVALTAGYAVTPQMRLSAKLSYAIHEQNEPFLPYTAHPNLRTFTPLPRTSLDGDIRKTFANLTLTAHEGRNLDFVASYTFDDRENRTPQAVYSYIANDVMNQTTPAQQDVSRYTRINLPHSFTFHKAKAEIGYRLAPRTRLSLVYTGDFRSRDYQPVRQLNEHAARAKAQTTFSQGSVWLGYTYAARTGSEYLDYIDWNASHTAAYLAEGPGARSIQHPLFRRYDLADRRRHEVKSGATYDITQSLTASFSGGYAKDNYIRSELGIQSADSLMADADLTYVLQERLTASAYYTFERMRSHLRSYFLFTALLDNPSQVWNARSRDTTHSGGLSVDWNAVPEKLKVSLSSSISGSTMRMDVTSTPFAPLALATPLPDATELTYSVGGNVEYFLRQRLSLRLGYAFEHHLTDDWRYIDSLTPVAQILGSGELPPRYDAHVVWISARTRF